MGQKWEFRNELSHLQSIDFSTESQENSMGGRIVFSTHKLGQLAIHNKRMMWNPFPVAYTKMISMWTKDLNTRLEAGKGQAIGPKDREHWIRSQSGYLGLHTGYCDPLALDFWGWQMSVTDAEVTPLRQELPGKHFPSLLQFLSFESRHWCKLWSGMILQRVLLSLRKVRAVAFQ